MRTHTMAGMATLGLTCFAAVPALADNIPQQEYNKYVDKHRTIQALDSSLFGEQINLRDGGVSCHFTMGGHVDDPRLTTLPPYGLDH